MEEFRNALIKVISENPLPLEAKFYVVKDVFRDVSEGYYSQLEAINKQKEQKGKEVSENAEGV